MRVTPNYFIIMFVEFLHIEKKDFPRVTLVFEDGKWVGANKMTLAASSYLCAAAWQKKASAPTDLYEGNSEQYFGGIPPPGIMLNARNFSATYYTSREVWNFVWSTNKQKNKQCKVFQITSKAFLPQLGIQLTSVLVVRVQDSLSLMFGIVQVLLHLHSTGLIFQLLAPLFLVRINP